MLEKIIMGLFKGFFMLLGFLIKGIYQLIAGVIQRQSHDVYAPAANPGANDVAKQPTSTSAPATPAMVAHLPEKVESDPLFAEADALMNAGQHEDALNKLIGIGNSNDGPPKVLFQLAHRYFVLFELWSQAYPEPDEESFPEWEDRRPLLIEREHTLRKPLKQGCLKVELLLARNDDFPNGKVLGCKLYGALAQSGWNWGPKDEGFEHQKRVIELTEALIDYDLLDLAQRCALEGQVFGKFFDLAESLFKQGRIIPEEHHYAAMVYEGAVHSDRWPLSATDRRRAPEFLKAALAHLEYCQRHNLETGPHWHNVMARVLAGRGELDEARYHFQRFKDLAAKEEDGAAMIAIFGKETIQVLNHYIGEHNSRVERSRRR